MEPGQLATRMGRFGENVLADDGGLVRTWQNRNGWRGVD